MTTILVPTSASGKEPYFGPQAIPAGQPIYGRDQEIFELSNRLLSNHVVLMHALSGAGKTSMIQAGLAPRLVEMGFQVLPLARVNRTPNLDTLPEQMRGLVNPFRLSVLLSFESNWQEDQRLPLADLAEMPLATYLAQRFAAVDETTQETRSILLIFDQFEEIFTLRPIAHDQREDFFAWLMPVLYDVRYWTLFSMRDDYIGGLEPYLDYLPDRLSARFRLEFLRQEGAIDAIRKPVEPFGVNFQEEAARLLVNNLRMVKIVELDQTREELGNYIEPIQLQVVCLKLWRTRSQPGEISLEDVEKSGNVDKALADYYNDVLVGIAGDDIRLQRSLRDWIQRALIIEDSFRVSSLERQLVAYGLEPNTVQALINAFLVRMEKRMGANWYELAHDRLVRPVVDDNRRWRERSLRPWQLAAERWNADGRPVDSALLLKDDALREAQTGFNPSLGSPVDLAFLEASKLTYNERSSRWNDPARLERVRLGTNLDEVGWGIIFAQDASPGLREALNELIGLRQEAASRNREQFFHIFEGLNGYRPGDTARSFLRRNGIVRGLTNPEKVPYYLLIVGDPQSIPFSFQYELDLDYAVGRIYFERLEQYQSYARSVKLCEGGAVRLPRRAAIFSPRFPGDRATEFLVNSYSRPLAEGLRAALAGWHVDLVQDEQTGKAGLGELLGGPPTPALLVVTSHASGDEQNLGAVLCAGWPGGTLPGPEFYFSAGDVSGDQGSLLGLIAVISGNYTAGAPPESDFSFYEQENLNIQEAPRGPLLARLPQALLGHPRGGALAVIAHVDKIWTTSFLSESGKVDIGVYQDLLARLMQGYTAGAAMELLNQRSDLLNSLLQEQLQKKVFYDQPVKPDTLKLMLVSALDARNYVLLGDPAVRLPVASEPVEQTFDAEWIRPEIEAVAPIQAQPVSATPPAESPAPTSGDLWYASGIDALTGRYALTPLTSEDLRAQIMDTERSVSG